MTIKRRGRRRSRRNKIIELPILSEANRISVPFYLFVSPLSLSLSFLDVYVAVLSVSVVALQRAGEREGELRLYDREVLPVFCPYRA